MNLKNLSGELLVSNLKQLVVNERRIGVEILWHLRELERRRLFADLGYSSLFTYCVSELKYSEASAYRRIQAMRVLRELPELESKIESGSLSVMAVSQVQSFLKTKSYTNTEKLKLFVSMENKTQKECERHLAILDPESVLREKLRSVNETQTEIRFVADEKLMQKLQKIRNLSAHKKVGTTFAELIEHMADELLKKLDPAKPVRGENLTKSIKTFSVKVKSRYVPAQTRRQIHRRDQSCCQYQNSKTGKVCGSTYGLQLDHKTPYALKGSNEPENLQLLCFQHNQLRARQMGLFRPALGLKPDCKNF